MNISSEKQEDFSYAVFDYDILDISEIVKCLKNIGAVQLTKAISSSYLKELSQKIEIIFNKIDQDIIAKNRNINQSNIDKLYSSFNAHYLEQEENENASIFVAIENSLLEDVFKLYFNSEIEFDRNNSYIRRIRCGKNDIQKGAPFHQDASVVSIGKEMLTCWIPLIDCGVYAPSIEFLLNPLNCILVPKNVISIDEEPFDYQSITSCYSVAELPEKHLFSKFNTKQLWQPNLFLGDVMIFTETVIHRTYVTPKMKTSRNSIDIRLYPIVR